MDVCEETYDIMNTSVGLPVRLTTASEVMHHTVVVRKNPTHWRGEKRHPCFFPELDHRSSSVRRSMDDSGSGVAGHLRPR
jgi:hypothetical protein